MAASSGGMNGNGDPDTSYTLPANVHVFDFKFKTEEISENLNYLLINELVKHFGNPAYYSEKNYNCNVNTNSSSETTGSTSVENAKKKEGGENRGVDVHHRVLDTCKNKSNVLKTALNKKYLCLLLEDGSVQRASCESVDTGLPSNRASNGAASPWNRTTEAQNFQVASDESYARSVHRGLNNDRLNLLAGRRSYLGRSNSYQLGHHGVLQGRTSGSSVLPQPREFFSLQRVSPTFRTGRYVPTSPFDRDSRPNRRHIQMGHLLNIPTVNVPTAPRTMVYTTSGDDDMGSSLSSMTLPDVSIDNITIVSLDDATDQPSSGASEFRISNFGFPNISPTNIHNQEDQPVDIQTEIDSSLPSAEGESINMPSEFVNNTDPITPNYSRLLSDNMLNGSNILNEFVPNTPPRGSSSTDLQAPFSVLNNIGEASNPTAPSDNQTETSSSKEGESTSSFAHSSKLNNQVEGTLSSSSPITIPKGVSWVPDMEELKETPEMDVKFTSLHAMESAFVLVDADGVLWLWNNNEAAPMKAEFSWNGKHKIISVGCNLLRATVLFNSKHVCTFYDKCFTYINNGEEPMLIKTLSHEPNMFIELVAEDIADIQCSNFFTAIHTVSGKVFWWGLTPSSERNSVSLGNNAQSQDSTEIHINDMVSLSKQGKNETGALVFNDRLQQFGVVMQQMSEEVITQNLASNKIAIQLLVVNGTKSESKQRNMTEIWECKDIVYLQEPNSFTGKVISLDGPYAIVQHNDSSEDHEKLKVYFKSSLEKISPDESDTRDNNENSKVGRSRYQKYLFESPMPVFSDSVYTVAAMHASEIGIALLVNRIKDEKAFLIFPECANFHYVNWFTCAKKDIEKNENIKSESGATVEFESTPSFESNLCIMSQKTQTKVWKNSTPVFGTPNEENMYEHKELGDEVLHTAKDMVDLECALCNHENHKIIRSYSLPAGMSHRAGAKRKWSDSISYDEQSNAFSKPTLISISNYQNYFSILLDNIGCLYPVRFGSCLSNPPLLEITPFQSFILFDRGNGHNKDERLLTVIAVPKASPLLNAIRSGDKPSVENLLSIEKSQKKGKVENPAPEISGQSEENILAMMNECCNGNQNIMHVAASNILKIQPQGPIHGNIMEIRNIEENAILHMLLDNITIWPHVKKLLCERDSHGATPFMSALLMQNLRGAYLILVAIKQDGKSIKVSTPKDKKLFERAICTPTFSGLSPLHALIHSSSKKPSSQQWFNTLKVSNLPPNYSSRLLLKLFKSRYPSVYRAVMPIPKPLWPQQNVRNKVKGEVKQTSTSEGPSSKRGKSKLQPPPQLRASLYRNTITPSCGLSVSGRQFTNRADAIRANAKEGLIMFGNIDEMFQALLEMNNHSLLTKADHPSGALLSVVQHLLQVQQYQETLQKLATEEQQNPPTTVKPLYVAPMIYTEFGVENSANGSSTSTSKAGNSQEESNSNREDTISKCFDDIMVHLLLTSLVAADPTIATIGNSEGETALCYFVKTYPRFSPSHLHKLFLNWRPCNLTNCKYNRHVGKLSVTCLSEVESSTSNNNNDKKKASKADSKKSASASDIPGSSMHVDNPILSRRGLASKSKSLILNVKENHGGSLDAGSSPITPSIRVLDNLKYAPIEITTSTGLTPQNIQSSSSYEPMHDPVSSSASSSTSRRSGFSPFFPPISTENEVKNGVNSNQSKDDGSTQFCTCHLNKARLLWNTTFEASTFFLAKNWPCVAATIISPSHYQKMPDASNITLVDSNKLDSFTENLLLNPYNVLLEVFVKTLIIKFQESKLISNAKLLSTLHAQNPTDMNFFKLKINTGLLPWLAVHRFVRSLVRQLSLCLSKNSLPDGSLKYKIGRFANKSHSKKEVRMKENLSLCLKAFSWISVLEILRAAVVMLKPIRSGTVKAQAKGIIRDIHNAGHSSAVGRGSLPAGMRVHVPSSGTNVNQRTIIRNASRMQQSSSSVQSPGSSLMLEASFGGVPTPASSQTPVEDTTSDTEDSSRLDDSFVITDITASPLERNDSDLNEVDWNQSQGITPESSVAWAVDGHIRVRNEVSNRLLPPPGLWQFNPQNHIQQQIMNTPSVHAGYLYLARMFCRLVKEATDLATALKSENPQEYGPNPGAFSVQPIKFSSEVETSLMDDADKLLSSSWDWMKNVLNTLEKQLKEGENFDTKHFVLRLKKSGQENEIAGLGRPSLTHMYGSSPDEYMMYLLKQDMGEAENSLPVLDLFSFTHMTYILDAYLYMNKSKPFSKIENKHREEKNGTIQEETEVPNDTEKINDINLSSTWDAINMKFFKDAIDMSCGTGESKHDDFKRHVEEKKLVANQISVWLDETIGKKPRSNASGTKFSYVNETEWDYVIDAFTTLFLTEGPGYERDSFLAVKAGSSGRISRFQRSLAAVRGADSPNRSYAMASVNPENPALLINVVRSKLLEDCIGIFSEDMGNHPFGCLRVRFEGEEGTGPGVNRGLFAAFANALKSGKKYKQWPLEFFAECGNLPSQQGIFSPKGGKYECVDAPTVYFGHPMSQEKRYSAFVAIGRFLGLALWFNYTIPIVFSRPMLLFLLGRANLYYQIMSLELNKMIDCSWSYEVNLTGLQPLSVKILKSLRNLDVKANVINPYKITANKCSEGYEMAYTKSLFLLNVVYERSLLLLVTYSSHTRYRVVFEDVSLSSVVDNVDMSSFRMNDLREEDLVFDDLAFFDSALYASFSQLIIDAFFSNYSEEEFMDLYDICFEASIESHNEELIPGGKQIRVTKKNCLSYIRLYTRTLLIQSRENELQGIRDGLTQMIPKELLENLEPEDLQLLLSGGVEDVGYGRLRSIISFSNSRGCAPEVLERYKTWFWKIVQKMTSAERQKLLYFATGSSVLPALDNRVGNNEELSITVDIINSSNSSALPMSSTCGQRISIPLYPTKTILKNKLLQAIECQSYGLG